METLKAKTRENGVKAKKLRKEGWVTGSLCGHELDHSLAIQLDANEAKRFLNNHSVGSKITLVVDGVKYLSLIKSIDIQPATNKLLDINFMQLVANERVKAVAEVVFENEDKARGFLTCEVRQIEYKALPKHIVEKVVIDVSKYKVGETLTVGDLEMSKDKNIEVLTSPDINVLHVVSRSRMKASAEETEEGVTEESIETASKAS
ncbi:50S ribosomal protein L25 [Lachnobacterium bovis]|uniref:Large subunit ribosomal protein L25 n=1 Tax=Lachnobacterium bovis TaxID=140626 RepID=A0A1H9T6T2_9FIRM|nr:50S ribosomal protein L25 [Lachnobacterium bovis]SER92858.1 large subunit ribosomal protein L25 [Lachnobacterium bovis]